MDKNSSEPLRYIDPFADFGFKVILMDPKNKVLLIDFLNAALATLG